MTNVEKDTEALNGVVFGSPDTIGVRARVRGIEEKIDQMEANSTKIADSVSDIKKVVYCATGAFAAIKIYFELFHK